MDDGAVREMTMPEVIMANKGLPENHTACRQVRLLHELLLRWVQTAEVLNVFQPQKFQHTINELYPNGVPAHHSNVEKEKVEPWTIATMADTKGQGISMGKYLGGDAAFFRQVRTQATRPLPKPIPFHKTMEAVKTASDKRKAQQGPDARGQDTFMQYNSAEAITDVGDNSLKWNYIPGQAWKIKASLGPEPEFLYEEARIRKLARCLVERAEADIEQSMPQIKKWAAELLTRATNYDRKFGPNIISGVVKGDDQC